MPQPFQAGPLRTAGSGALSVQRRIDADAERSGARPARVLGDRAALRVGQCSALHCHRADDKGVENRLRRPLRQRLPIGRAAEIVTHMAGRAVLFEQLSAVGGLAARLPDGGSSGEKQEEDETADHETSVKGPMPGSDGG